MKPDFDSTQIPIAAQIRRKMNNQLVAQIASAAKTILRSIGEDPEREALRKTPERFAKAMAFFTEGYGMSTRVVAPEEAIFEVQNNDMVIVRDIHVASLCEHHLVPFVGKIHIEYVPKGRVLGLSKFARIVEMYARRLQVQERLTEEIASAVQSVLVPDGIMVVAECSHMCMVMRGVQQTGSTTITQCKKGIFRDYPQKAEEFLALLSRPGA